MHTVGNMPDGGFGRGQALPQIIPHVARHHAVEAADAVGPAREPQGQHRHFKGVAVAALDLPELHELLPAKVKVFCHTAEIAFHQFQREGFVARRHGGVGGKQCVGAYTHHSFVMAHALGHAVPHALKGHKGRMPLVHVVNAGDNAEGAQQAHAALTEQYFLQQACFAVGLIQTVGDASILVRIAAGVRVHKIEAYAAYL